MIIKLIVLFLLITMAHSIHVHIPKSDIDYYAYPEYKFSYGVDDPHTGDHKSQHEVRHGDMVKGYYSVADPDGTYRTVHYTADKHNGFNAVVSRSGKANHPKVYGKTTVSLFAAEPLEDHAL